MAVCNVWKLNLVVLNLKTEITITGNLKPIVQQLPSPELCVYSHYLYDERVPTVFLLHPNSSHYLLFIIVF